MTTEKIHFTKEKETMLMMLNGRAILNNLFRGQPMIFLKYIVLSFSVHEVFTPTTSSDLICTAKAESAFNSSWIFAFVC